MATGQNDPADIPKLIAARDQQRGVQLFMGNRKAEPQGHRLPQAAVQHRQRRAFQAC
jgi:hypothetical protein